MPIRPYLLIIFVCGFVGSLLSINVQAQNISSADREVITPDNIEQLEQLHYWQEYTYNVPIIAFNPATDHLVTIGPDAENVYEFRYFSIEENAPSRVDHNLKDVPQLGPIAEIEFFNNEQNMAVAVSDGGAFVWNVQSGDLTAVVGQQWTRDIAGFRSDLLIASGDLRMIAQWNISTSIPLSDNELPLTEDFNFSPRNVSLLLAGQSNAPIADIISDPTHPYIFVLNEDGIIYKYTLTNLVNANLLSLPQESQTMRSEPIYDGSKQIALHPGSEWIAYTGSYRDLIVYDYLNDRQLLRYPAEAKIGCVLTSPDGRLLVVGEQADDASLIFIDTQTMQVVSRVSMYAPVYDCDYSADGRTIATAHPSGHIALWGLQPF